MTVRCDICPKGCQLAEGETGDCQVRINLGGKIRCMTHERPCSLNVDPVEKKPLYHFLPGSRTLSIGTSGCNLHCKQCQNWEMSQSNPISSETSTADEIAKTAMLRGCPSVAYTYAEPLVSYEFTKTCCEAAENRGLKNALVTAAYINPKPLRELCTHVDAANVDLKSFSDDFYRDVCGAQLQPVLTALKLMKDMDILIEITTLLIPNLNDSEEETKQLSEWIVSELGPETPIHFSRFFPRHRLQHLPSTPIETILKAREIATTAGAHYVYVGNVSNAVGESTWCPECGGLLIERKGYEIIRSNIADGHCSTCTKKVYGIWS